MTRPYPTRWFMLTTSDRERFLSKTSIDLATGCVKWTGGLDPYGYGKFHLCRDGRKHKILAHRIAYVLANGPYDPRMQVDHVCLNRRCVSAEHLRLATHAQQQQHRAGAHRTSRSGVRGVSWYAQTGRWIGQVNVAGRRIHVGYFDSIAEAEAAVVAARLQHMTHSDPELRQEKIA